MRAFSPRSLVRENAVGVARSTPIADTCTTRRTPACSQAANSAAAPSTCTPFVESLGPSCSTPAQLTNASMPARCGSHTAGSRALAMSSAMYGTSAGSLAAARELRTTATTSYRRLHRLASTAEPIRPLAPVSSTRKASSISLRVRSDRPFSGLVVRRLVPPDWRSLGSPDQAACHGHQCFCLCLVVIDPAAKTALCTDWPADREKGKDQA